MYEVFEERIIMMVFSVGKNASKEEDLRLFLIRGRRSRWPGRLCKKHLAPVYSYVWDSRKPHRKMQGEVIVMIEMHTGVPKGILIDFGLRFHYY